VATVAVAEEGYPTQHPGGKAKQEPPPTDDIPYIYVADVGRSVFTTVYPTLHCEQTAADVVVDQ